MFVSLRDRLLLADHSVENVLVPSVGPSIQGDELEESLSLLMTL